MIKNPTIAGLRVYRGEIIGEADWPAIIPVRQWEEVNQILSDSARRTRYFSEDNHSHPKWLLSHIAKCGYCGRHLVRIHGTVPRKDGRPRNNYVCAQVGCRKISIDIERTDAYVTGVLMGWLTTPEYLALLSDPEDEWLDRVKEAQAVVTELQRRLDEVAAEYADGHISLTMLTNIEQRLTPQIEQASKAAIPPITDENLASILAAEDIETAWEQLGIVAQRQLLKSLLEIRIIKPPQRGGIFDTSRIKVAPRYAPSTSYRGLSD